MAKRNKNSITDSILSELNGRFCKEVNVFFEKNIDGSIISQGTQKAINRFDNDREEVGATRWFGDYLFFMRISFQHISGKQIMPFISVSFFQDIDGNPKQLFRAEWDSFENEGYNHPQPHWHFTAQLSDKTSFSDLQNAEEESIFSQLVGNSKSLNINRMHFAMGGSWYSNGNMLCDIEDENNLVNWLINLFRHVRAELEYKERGKE